MCIRDSSNSRVRTTGGTFTGPVNFQAGATLSVITPTNDAHAATKAYVDSVATGLDVKESVRLATTTSIANLFGLSAIDGVIPLAGQRILVKDNTGTPSNGIYEARAGDWTRPSDMDDPLEITNGVFVFVEEGNVNANTGWVVTTEDPINLNAVSYTHLTLPTKA